MKNTIITILALFLVWVGVRYLMTVYIPEQTKPTGMSEMTKQQYLDRLTEKGYGAFEHCFYDRVIDLVGVQETLKLDAKAIADEANADSYLTPEMKTIMAECAESEL